MSTSDVVSQISEAVSAAIAPLAGENELLKESIGEVRAMFAYEDQGWTAISGLDQGERQRGLSLRDVHKISDSARARVAGSALVKRAADLHTGYVFSGSGPEIDNTIREPGKGGRPTGEVAFYENPINQESIFSGAAKRELQYARFSDGNVIAFCDTSKKLVRRVPINEISNVLVNPEYPEEIWAWLREWDQVSAQGQTRTMQRWAYTNRFTGKRQQSISVEGKAIPVLKGVTAVDLRANRQVGYTFGVPDATAGLHWVQAYGEVLRYGQIVDESLAKIVYKVVQKTKGGAQNVGVKMSTGGAGQTAVVGEGQDIQLVNSSQRGFDFTNARPLAAMAAAAWNVSNIDLLSDSSAAGSSYGAAQSLTPGMQNAMQSMRDEWTQFFQDVFQACGFNRPALHWPPMEKPDAYRMAQELVLYSPYLFDEELRGITLDRLDVPGDASKIPPTLKARSDAAKQAASPDQGQANGTGGQDSGSLNDQRSDNISEAMRQVQNDDFLREMTTLVERMEAVKAQ